MSTQVEVVVEGLGPWGWGTGILAMISSFGS